MEIIMFAGLAQFLVIPTTIGAATFFTIHINPDGFLQHIVVITISWAIMAALCGPPLMIRDLFFFPKKRSVD